MSWALRRGLLGLVVCVSLVGCGSGHKAVALVGFAIAGNPLAGATISAVDMDGKTIATSPEKSLRTGTWYLPLKSVPKEFTLVATGGRDGGRAFHDQLRSVVRNYNAHDPRALHINPATTLLAAWLKGHPGATTAQATRAVERFLWIPQPLDLEADMRATDEFFSGASFMKGAKAAGGVAPFVNQLITELEAGDTHALLPARELDPKRKLQSNPNLAVGLVSSVTALQSLQAVSGAVSIASGIVSLIRGAQEQDQIAAIEGQLQQLETQFTQFQAQLDQLEALIDHAAYDNAVGPLASLETRLQITFPLYQNMLQSAGGSQAQIAAVVQAFEASIYDPTVDGADWRNTFRGGSDGIGISGVYGHLMALGAQTGALAAWTRMKGLQAVRFVDSTSQTNANYAITYWSNVQAQTLAINLAYEDAINNGSNPPSPVISMNTKQDKASFGGANVQAVLQQCTGDGPTTSGTNLLLREFNASKMCVAAAPADTFIDQNSGLMWGYGGPADIEGDVLDIGVSDYAQFLPSLTGWRLPTVDEIEGGLGSQQISTLGSPSGDNLAFVQDMLDNDPTVMWTSTYGSCGQNVGPCPGRRVTYDVASGNEATACAATQCGNQYAGFVGPATLNALYVRAVPAGEGPYAP